MKRLDASSEVNHLTATWSVQPLTVFACADGMLTGVFMFRIRKAGNGKIVFTLSGRIEADDIAEIQQQVGQESWIGPVVFDLKDVTLVNEGAIEFFARCEASNIFLQRCPNYIRKWIEQSKEAKVSFKR